MRKYLILLLILLFIPPATATITASYSVSPSNPDVGETVSFTDTSTSNRTITAWSWNFGDGNSSTSQNPTNVYGASGNYEVTLIVDNDLSETDTHSSWIYVSAVSPEPTSNESGSYNYTYIGGSNVTNITSVFNADQGASYGVRYPPITIELQFVDQYYKPLPAMYIQMTPMNTTVASGNWTALKGMYGLLVNNTSTDYDPQDPVAGYTDSSGVIIFPSLKPVYYQVHATDASKNISYTFNLMAGEDRKTVVIPWGNIIPQARTDVISYSLVGNYTTNKTYEVTVSYNDTSGNTTSVTAFVRNNNNGTYVNQQTASGSSINYTYSFDPTVGSSYAYGFEATSSVYGTIREFRPFNGPTEVNIPGLATEYRQWIAVAFTILFGAVFSAYSVRFGALIIPLVGYMFYTIGWLALGVGGAVIIPATIVIAVLAYIRKSENKI